MGHIDEHLDLYAWERQPGEPLRLFTVFLRYLTSAPRSIRKAYALAWKAEGRTPNAEVPGHLIRASVEWRWLERADAYAAFVAENDRAVFEAARLKARKRRVAQLERIGVLFEKRLAQMEPKNIPRGPHSIEVLLRVFDAERTELVDRPEDRHGEGKPDPGLPAIDDVIKPPSEPAKGENQ